MFKRYKYVEGLTSLLGSNKRYYINIFGKVHDFWGAEVPTKIDHEGYAIVNVEGWDGKRDYRILNLMAIQFKQLDIPKESYNDVIGFPMDGDKNNHHANNVAYRFKNRIQALGHPGYFHIPGHTRCAISEEGNLVNVRMNKKVNWSVMPPNPIKKIKGGYRVYSYSVDDRTRMFSRHRAMMLTFKDYPDNCDFLVVNHINGVPGDDRLENLEWMTRGENNTHAYVNDLKNQHDRVLSRDVITGEIVEYYSICECARKLGYPTDETIRQRLIAGTFSKVWQDGKQFKYKNDPRNWVIPEDPIKAVEEAKEYIEVISRNCLTGEQISHWCASEAGRKTGISDATIIYRLSKDDRSPLYGYQFKYMNDVRDFPSFTKEEYEASLIPKAFKVNARNLLTKEERDFDSVNTAAKTLRNLNISYVLRRGEQPLLPDGWQLKFENQEWEEIEEFEETLYKLRKEVMARCEKTGKVIVAESSKAMGEELKLDPKALRLAALTRGNKIYHGYRFRLGVTTESWPTE